jgi:hypothetical protein
MRLTRQRFYPAKLLGVGVRTPTPMAKLNIFGLLRLFVEQSRSLEFDRADFRLCLCYCRGG